MKPTPQINHNQRERGSRCDNGTRRSKRRFLLTDYNYRPTPETEMSSSPGRRVIKSPAFHKLSSEFFGAETSRDYIAEFSFFMLIAGVAAWPIISAIVAVTRLVRNY
ncbi:MAG: hypothetical protein DME50_18110 [Verrucomicrobia bacterium]|nr:MAG: hypothetical protein DME50_18110 [Verrucomicrobiota bacterium]